MEDIVWVFAGIDPTQSLMQPIIVFRVFPGLPNKVFLDVLMSRVVSTILEGCPFKVYYEVKAPEASWTGEVHTAAVRKGFYIVAIP